jgi:LacI family transcriptional regulator
MVTIKDVARKAGVSISTASYALNHDPRVKSDTKERILQVAKELNYYPSGAARNLKMKKKFTIGMCISDFGGPVYHEFLTGVHKELLNHGYNLIVTSGKSAERLLLERQIDAAIINDIHISDEILLMVCNESFPIIVLDRHLNHEHIHELMVENETLAYEMTKHLIEQGYQTIGYLGGSINSFDNLHRFKGFIKAIEEAGLSTEYYYQGDFTKESGYQLVKSLIETKQGLPRAFFAGNDEMAIGAMEALKEANIKIPMDVAVAGFDDIELAKYYHPSLTTVRIDRFKLGKHIAKQLMQIINQEDLDQTIPTPAQLVIRESS